MNGFNQNDSFFSLDLTLLFIAKVLLYSSLVKGHETSFLRSYVFLYLSHESPCIRAQLIENLA